MSYRVFRSNYFEKTIRKILTNEELNELDVFIKYLKKGIIRGKPLSYTFLRKKKIKEKRIYFLVYREIGIILFVTASTKKYQKTVIKKIKLFFDDYRELAYYFYNNY